MDLSDHEPISPEDDEEEIICAICGEQEINGIDCDAGEEGITVRGVKNVCLPSHLEIEDHDLAHLLFRDWCPYCVPGKEVSAAHKKRNEKEAQVPVISMDYMKLSRREPEEGEKPIIGLMNRKTEMKHANVVKNRGNENHYAIKRVAQNMISMGYRHFVSKSDQEPAI